MSLPESIIENPALPTVTIHVGDCRRILRTLPSDSVQCCVTSPPYWGLRDYGVKGQIGQEATPAEFVKTMVKVFREVRRVLKPDGTLWLNLGDSYAAKPCSDGSDYKDGRSNRGSRKSAGIPTDYKAKDLVGIPWLVALALRADGWYLRMDIIWSKPNPMPESVTDRPTKSHEYLFLLSKSERYYYDQDAILEKVSPNTHQRMAQNVAAQIGSVRANGGTRPERPMKTVGLKFDHEAFIAAEVYDDTEWMLTDIDAPTASKTIKMPDGAYHRKGCEKGTTRKFDPEAGNKNNPSFDAALAVMPEMRNKRSVWTVPTAPYSEAHFATYPPDLIKPCILAGTRPGDTVLDPFGGSGTTGEVALELGRHATLIELNPDYAQLAHKRTDVTPGLPLA